MKNAYTDDSIWRNRDTFIRGHDEIVQFLSKKWEKENGYRLRKELFAFTDNKVRESDPYAQTSLNDPSFIDCRAILVRMARRVWPVVANIRSRGLDVR